MLKSANIEGEDEEEEKIQDMEGLYSLFLGLFSDFSTANSVWYALGE